MKLLIDENISPIVTEHLRSLGYDVKSIRECCKGYDDEKVVEIALHEERTIITYDLDFGDLYRNFGVSSIILRLRTRNPAIAVKYLVSYLLIMKEHQIDMKGKLAVVTEGKIRTIG
ncbi:MAG: hypothetical protein A3I04_08165 [Nitrospinae bacterium RIFCSPLOWO2_02_FULL_39_110]|nr:MAG: hypothetical protein A2W53_08870 [Nitrospinae bacterium RIFCSPHIGHO2_02_39_11]OGV99089.1 MAG: hypothetical protein A3D97_03595 [Nitrospinae bacterium RIFCSPHIGHO2_12_FULL_39_42]OGW00658.1 MAG: hypothetical protein A3D20_04355 [Nitrospinae bacterium RIFCSPHIGHO2_02_FULL_39_82]OGW07296.1 MAG: hypothetical protein A3I04_08165 [Nitrospinae bacterium RIFCSPLOWO2_02_FULL_39_110]OGW07399.1 MAG: hypothetical protein A2Z59_03820 [Nitrospinae bacterium RIFCSPLOWO2_02_39_17]OGW11823.1 MAG: hypoth